MSEFLLLFLVGLVGGFLAGLIGIGGGAVYVLVLPYLLIKIGVPNAEIVQYTIANSLVGTMFAAMAGNVSLILRKEFYWKEVFFIGLLGAVFSFLTLHLVVNTAWYQRDEFNGVIIIVMAFVIFRTLRGNQISTTNRTVILKKHQMGVVGALAGALSALSGLGGGVVIIPILNLRHKMELKRAKSISLGVIFITSFAVTISNMLEKPAGKISSASVGYVVWSLVLILVSGVVIGSPIGVKVAGKMSNKTISYIFVLFLSIVIIDKAIQLLQ